MTSGKGFDGVDPPEFMDKVTHLTEKEDSKELRKWEPFETMVICAEIPRPQQQGPRPTGPDGEPQSSEATRSYHQPLMFIKYTAGGELEIQPSFIDKETCFYHQFTTPIIDGVGGETYRYEIENVREVQKKKVHMLRHGLDTSACGARKGARKRRRCSPISARNTPGLNTASRSPYDTCGSFFPTLLVLDSLRCRRLRRPLRWC